MKKILAIILIATLLLVSCGKENKPTIEDKDEFGCAINTGEKFCPSTQTCIITTETYCEEFKNEFPIKTFEECINAGNPIQESNPRQCNAGGKTFVEEIIVQEIPKEENELKIPTTTPIEEVSSEANCNACVNERLGIIYTPYVDNMLCSDNECTCKSDQCTLYNRNNDVYLVFRYTNELNETVKTLKFNYLDCKSDSGKIKPYFKLSNNYEGISFATASPYFISTINPGGFLDFYIDFDVKDTFHTWPKIPEVGDKRNIDCTLVLNSSSHGVVAEHSIKFVMTFGE